MRNRYRTPNMGGSTISTKLTVRLIGELREGGFSAAERLPSEVELAGRYGVSRSVIRDVLASLEREGFVKRGRGVGTVVNRAVVGLPSRLDLKLEYHDLVRGLGLAPATDQVRVTTESAGEAVARRLELEAGAPLIVCEKRILADGKPVIFSIDRLPAALFGAVDWRALDWSMPVFDLLEDHCGILVDTSVTWLSAVAGPPGVRRRLNLADGEALTLLEEVGSYKLTQPILHSCGYYTNAIGFTLLRKQF